MASTKDTQRYRKTYSFFRSAPRFEVAAASGGGGTLDILDWKNSVKSGQTTNLSLPSWPTANVIGSYLTSDPGPIGGVSLSDNDRFLLTGQSTSSQNGIWLFRYDPTGNNGGGTWWFERPSDVITGNITSGATVYVDAGDNAQTYWSLTTLDPITVDTTGQTWKNFTEILGLSSLISTNSKWYDDYSVQGYIRTTGSVAISGPNPGSIQHTPHVGQDVFFYVSGSKGSRSTSTRGTSAFGGDLVVSGALIVINDSTNRRGITGSITQIAAGVPFLKAGNGILITTGSSNGAEGQITITSVLGSSGVSWYNSTYGTNNNVLTADGLGAIIPEANFNFDTNSSVLSVTGTLVNIGSASFDSKARTAAQIGSNVFFYVSGSISGSGVQDKQAVFGGDTHVSGAVLVEADILEVTGSALVKGVLKADEAYLVDQSRIYFGPVNSSQVAINATNDTLRTYAGDSLYFVANAADGGGTSFSISDSTNKNTSWQFISSSGTPLLYLAHEFSKTGLLIHGKKSVTTVGTDVIFYSEGTIGSKNSTTRGTAVFGGDLVVSGSITSAGGVIGASSGGNWKELSPTPRLSTSASVSIAGAKGDSYAAQNVGTDVFFFVSGTIGLPAASAKVSVFGGDVYVSGTINANNITTTVGSWTVASGSVTLPYAHVVTAQSPYTVTNSNYYISCSGTITLNMPTAVGIAGRTYVIKNKSIGTITVTPNGSQTIDGASSLAFSTQYTAYTIVSDGANWMIV